LDYQFRGTYWVVAHFHYVMFGGSAALFGALYYWFPKMTGKMYNEFLGKVNFALFFVGFNLLYFPLFVAWETPRRVFEYAQNLVTWHQLASIGGVITAVSFLVMFINLVYSLRKGDEAPDNPWQGSTIEWGVPSPPPIENFPGIPSFREGKLKFVRTVSGGAEDATADGGKKTQSGIEILDVETDGGAAIGGGHEGKESHASIWPFAISLTAAILFIGVSGISNTAEGLKIAAPFYPPLAVIGAVG
ncbi:MAG: cbb3-type cytochrome c oxidase subunit I, partial [Halobacteria archaeon]|nr:cbb3-type cytochrome c oxidase subunit I [Halobacteria archaeon]